jgi:hypothetical protein
VSQPWIANVKNKTFTLAVYAVRADVDDVVLIAAEARGRALSFNGTVEATQSGSGVGTELVANLADWHSRTSLSDLRSICSLRCSIVSFRWKPTPLWVL